MVEREMCTKTLRDLSEKLGANFDPSTSLGYSLLRIFGLDNAFSEILQLEESLVNQSHCIQLP